MENLKNCIKKNLDWFINSGVMVPENGLWGVAERLAVKSGNRALELILESFPAWSDQDDCYVIEQRRADCNFQTAWLFLKAEKLFPGNGYGDIGKNILDFLYFRSGLLERNPDAPIPANWNWSHIKQESTVYFDDEAWCILIQLNIAGEFPELDRKYQMRKWAYRLAESLYAGVMDKENKVNWRGNLQLPHWGALAAMALAQAATDETRKKYQKFCLDYFTNLTCPNVSEDAYALIGAVNCALKLDKEIFFPIAKKHADTLISKFDPDNGFPPSEHARETPTGKNLVDTIYTVNWSLLGLREFGLIAGKEYSAYADKLIALLCRIQDTADNKHFYGCWRGMFDINTGSWGGGDLFEGGGNSIYTGWTNAPISLCFLHEYDHASMF
ncbi:MAG: hypothetical protein IJY46_06105 [Lentisphaeria bacterium]|nr:hypothetical protein [Lentisphaeria bacterium]